MKNIFCIITFLVFGFTHAQESFGLKASVQTSGITNAKFGDNQNGYGANVGFYYRLGLNTKWSFQSELNYSFQNIRNLSNDEESFIIDDKIIDYYYQIHYLKVPLLMRFQPKKIYGEFGPEIAYMFSNKVKLENDELNVKDTSELENPNEFQLNLVLGGGYQINDRLDTGIRVSWGFTPIADQLEYDIKVFNISAGISYKIK